MSTAMRRLPFAVLVVIVLALSACQRAMTNSRGAPAKPAPQLTQQDEEGIMTMALHHNRDEVFAHMKSLGDFSWQKTRDGLLNLDCSIAIQEKHNQRYPKSPWEVEGIDIRNRVAGPLDEDRRIAAHACAESYWKKGNRWSRRATLLRSANLKPVALPRWILRRNSGSLMTR
jgi:hypothetical protein